MFLKWSVYVPLTYSNFGWFSRIYGFVNRHSERIGCWKPNCDSAMLIRHAFKKKTRTVYNSNKTFLDRCNQAFSGYCHSFSYGVGNWLLTYFVSLCLRTKCLITWWSVYIRPYSWHTCFVTQVLHRSNYDETCQGHSLAHVI